MLNVMEIIVITVIFERQKVSDSDDGHERSSEIMMMETPGVV